jgi:hypothetical protein
MRLARLGGAAVVLSSALLVVTGPSATAQSPSRSPSAAGRPPVLDRFTAAFEPTTGATKYTVAAHDPDGGKVAYRWSLKASCGALGNPSGTGPTNTYEHGPPVRKPNGCPGDDERAATLTLTIADSAGCAIEYTQGGRDETVHVRPRTRTLPCTPIASGGKGRFPAGLILLILIALIGGLAVVRRVRARPQRPADIAPKPRRTPQAARTQQPGRPPQSSSVSNDVAEDATEWQPAAEAVFEPFEGCLEGSVQNQATEVVAHETVLAGPIVVVASGDAGTWRVELTENTETTRAELTTSLGIVPGRTLEIRADISVRAVTAICEHREVCRAGHWVRDASSSTREGAERVEVIRARASSPEDFDRFADEVLGPRLASLRRGRRRVDGALERCRSEPVRADAPATEG